MALDKFEGEWNTRVAKHLLNRVSFSITKSSIDKFVSQGMDLSVLELLQDLPEISPPVNPEYEVDPNVPIGETWVDKPELEGTATLWWRTIRTWSIRNMIYEGISAREKMTLFWHNHFVTSSPDEPQKHRYQYFNLLSNNCFGNFRELTKEITINPSMLFFLNGDTNTSESPNENYARELLELFTVGKGQLVGPGDYSRFTESDVLSVSKILTGWKIDYSPNLPDLGRPVFRSDLHDSSQKQLSSYFNNEIINDAGDEEYSNLIDIIFESPNTSLNIVRDLYIWFVHYEINEFVEAEVIQPLANLLVQSDYEIKPVLKCLFESSHFYESNCIGGKIKSPFELVINFTKTFDIEIPDSLKGDFRWNYGISNICDDMGQATSKFPTVAGWKAYYQSPNYYELWIDAITLPLRMSFVEKTIMEGQSIIGYPYKVDVLNFISKIENAINPNLLIEGISNIIYSNPISEDRVAIFKSVLIPGLPDFEWSVEYQDYLDDSLNEEKRLAVENRVKVLIATMLSAPEYQLH